MVSQTLTISTTNEWYQSSTFISRFKSPPPIKGCAPPYSVAAEHKSLVSQLAQNLNKVSLVSRQHQISSSNLDSSILSHDVHKTFSSAIDSSISYRQHSTYHHIIPQTSTGGTILKRLSQFPSPSFNLPSLTTSNCLTPQYPPLFAVRLYST